MKKLSIFLVIFITSFFIGCNDSSVSTQSEIETDNPLASYQFTMKITQHVVGGANHVILSEIFNSSGLGFSTPVYFTTLSSRDGNSTFTIEYGATWSNTSACNAYHFLFDTNQISPFSSSIYIVSSGSFNHSQSLSLQEAKTYYCQMGPWVWDEDDD